MWLLETVGNHEKSLLQSLPKVDLDRANLRNYCTDFLEFLYVNKSYFGGNLNFVSCLSVKKNRGNNDKCKRTL